MNIPDSSADPVQIRIPRTADNLRQKLYVCISRQIMYHTIYSVSSWMDIDITTSRELREVHKESIKSTFNEHS